MDRLNEKFMREVGRIKEPEVFVGVARVLGVKLIGEDKENRDFAYYRFPNLINDGTDGYR